MTSDDNTDNAALIESLRARIAELERSDAERHRVEEALLQSNANLSALIESTSDLILFRDHEGLPVLWNSAYAAALKEVVGIDMEPGLKAPERFPDPATRALWDGYHRRVLSGEQLRVEYEHSLGDGKVSVFEFSYNPVRVGEKIIGFSQFSREITERKQHERTLREAHDRLELQVAEQTRELRASESRFRALVERSSDLTFIIDRDGRFSYASPSVRAFGTSPEDIIGATPADFVPPEDLPRVEALLQQAIERPGSVVPTGVLRGRPSSGDYVDIEGKYICLFEVEGVEGIVFNGRDVTERRQLESRLRQSEKMDALGQLAGGIAHDFNNQLTGILATAELLKRQLSDETLRGYAAQIGAAARRSAELTGKMLTFARQGECRSVEIDINQVITDVMSLLRHSIDKQIDLDLDLTESDLRVMGEPTLLQNMLLNLALNARDAMPSGGTLTIRSRLCTLDNAACARLSSQMQAGTYVRVSVSDIGVGMDTETQRRMFEPFFTTKEPGKGTGMGLASVYGAVQSHGGAITATSELGRGTTFEIHLPVADADALSTCERPPPRGRSGLRIIVVDDEQTVRMSLASLLEYLEHTVVVFADGKSAVDHFRQSADEIDIVVLDMSMPGMDGRTTFLAMQEIDPNLRVLIISGHTSEGTAQTMLDYGARGFLRKPFSIDGIIEAIMRACEDEA